MINVSKVPNWPIKNAIYFLCECTQTYQWYRGYYDKNRDYVTSDKKGRPIAICNKCYKSSKYEYIDNYKDDAKRVANIRNDGVDMYSESGMSIISEAVVAKFLKIDILSIKNDNFTLCVDLEHGEHGKIDVKSAKLKYGMWSYLPRRKIDCDTYFLIGFSKNLSNIDDVRIVPNEGCICGLKSITIVENPYRSSKYEEFKVDNTPYDEIYQNLRSYLGNKKLVCAEDIKKWSNRFGYKSDDD